MSLAEIDLTGSIGDLYDALFSYPRPYLFQRNGLNYIRIGTGEGSSSVRPIAYIRQEATGRLFYVTPTEVREVAING